INMVPPPGRIVRGSVLLNGRDILTMNDDELRKVRGSEISIVFQDPFTTLDPLRKIDDQFMEFLVEHGLDKQTARARVGQLLEEVGIPQRLWSAYPHQLSGGQKQRVAIAMAVALNPQVMIADEPTTALDVVTQKQIMELMNRIRKDHGVSIILITHDLALALEWADTILVMYGGEVMEYASKVEIMHHPLHPYTMGLLESLPRMGSKTLPKHLPGNPPDLKNPPRGCVFHPRCIMAHEVCKLVKPQLREVVQGHYVACNLVRV
ncbi:MAG: ABC transporter ATP-binding protein, partial [Vulcanisaeta sp.]